MFFGISGYCRRPFEYRSSQMYWPCPSLIASTSRKCLRGGRHTGSGDRGSGEIEAAGGAFAGGRSARVRGELHRVLALRGLFRQRAILGGRRRRHVRDRPSPRPVQRRAAVEIGARPGRSEGRRGPALLQGTRPARDLACRPID